LELEGTLNIIANDLLIQVEPPRPERLAKEELTKAELSLLPQWRKGTTTGGKGFALFLPILKLEL
jgi:hypothetical protein